MVNCGCARLTIVFIEANWRRTERARHARGHGMSVLISRVCAFCDIDGADQRH